MKLINIDTLERDFSGEVIRPGDRIYEQASKTYLHQGAPAVVFRPAKTGDVALALQHARSNSLILSIRSGGHSGAGLGTNTGGVVIDLSALNKIEVIDRERGLVRIGAGATWGEVARVLQSFQLALSSGDTTTVGVGGLTLGGGIGWMVRKVGLAIDRLVAAEVVTAAGRTLRASATEHPDLFWAVRGGGGNFGVVTNFEFAAFPLNKVYAGVIVYSLDNLAGLLKGWRDTMRAATEDLTTMLVLMPAFAGNPPAAIVMACYASDDEARAKSAIDPLLQIGKVIQQDIQEKYYADVLEEAHMPEGVQVIVKNGLVKDFSDELIEAITSMYGQADSPALQLRSLGGQMKRVAADATAFAHRDSELLVVAPTFVPLEASDREISQAMKPWRTIAPFTSGAYVNFFSTATDEDVAASYPHATYERLAKIKRIYDPENIFNQNYNIKPAD